MKLYLIQFICIAIGLFNTHVRAATVVDTSTVDTTPITRKSTVRYDSSMELIFDPPNGFFSPSAMSVFVRSNYESALIYYAVDNQVPTLSSPYCTRNSPYIQLNTPFGYGRMRNISIIAVTTTIDGLIRSKQINLHYFVEGSNRPSSYAFLVPGVESGGYFIGVGIEMNATARAQSSGSNAAIGGQEFADFFAHLGVGTYNKQVSPLLLTTIDPQLTGFEGGFAANTTDGRHYGILVPFFDGTRFVGKVVRVDLKHMISNFTTCLNSWRKEVMLPNKTIQITGNNPKSKSVCITILDLASVHPLAKGFRKGFVNYPYGYLSPGQYNVAVRLNIDKFTLASTDVLDLGLTDYRLGGYSGGFSDGTWACFCPFKTFQGPVGGLRSKLEVDANHIRAYYHGMLTCVNATAWKSVGSAGSAIQVLDISDLSPNLRGFSEAVRVGRYAYLSPLSTDSHTYSSSLIRIFLGETDIGHVIHLQGDLITVLDLTQKDPGLKGFSGLYNIGKYVILVPFRNTYEPRNGQRGHGLLTRIDLNDFTVSGITSIDVSATTRLQTPSFNDVDLRCFSGGFANGMYGLLVPFYNGVFHGKMVRYNAIFGPLEVNLQELDLTHDRVRGGIYKGYRGGFVSLWQGVFP